MSQINLNELPPVEREHKSIPHNQLLMLVVIVVMVLTVASMVTERGDTIAQKLANTFSDCMK